MFGRVVDVTDRAAFKAFLDEVEAELGPIDVLINNAGIMPLNRIEDETDRATHDIIGLNLMAVIYATKEMVTRHEGAGDRRPDRQHLQRRGSHPDRGRVDVRGEQARRERLLQLAAHRVQGRQDADPDLAWCTPRWCTPSSRPASRPTRARPSRSRPSWWPRESSLRSAKPRPNIYVPRSLGPSVRSGALIPAPYGGVAQQGARRRTRRSRRARRPSAQGVRGARGARALRPPTRSSATSGLVLEAWIHVGDE